MLFSCTAARNVDMYIFQTVQVWKYRLWTLVRRHRFGMKCIPRLTKQKPGLLDESEVQTMPVVCYEPHIYKNAILGSPPYKYGETYALHTMGALVRQVLFPNFPAFYFVQIQRHMNSNFPLQVHTCNNRTRVNLTKSHPICIDPFVWNE